MILKKLLMQTCHYILCDHCEENRSGEKKTNPKKIQ